MENTILEEIFLKLLEDSFYTYSPAVKKADRKISKILYELKQHMSEEEYERRILELSDARLFGEICGFALGFKYAVNLFYECTNSV